MVAIIFKLGRWAIRLLVTLGAVAAAVTLLLSAGAWLVFRYAPGAAPDASAPNAVWAAHWWAGEPHEDETYDALAGHLMRNHITDVYFHVGPLTGAGLIPQGRHRNAAALVSKMHQRAPGIRLHAWIGQVERRGGGPLDLADPRTRRNIVQSAAGFVALGFDGIHYNIEPIRSGDAGLLALLEETATVTRAKGKLLSMATDELTPLPGLEHLAALLFPQAGLWREDYYREVAARTDQVAVMMYDTAMPFDWLYGAIVAWETWRLRDIVGADTTLFVGVPTYDDETFGFHPRAENMRSGLRGICIGLSFGDRSTVRNLGAAIYAGWTTDEDEWAIWRRDWLGEAR